MTLKRIFIIVAYVFSMNSTAGTMGPIQSIPGPPLSSLLPWAVIGSLGYTNYQNISDCDGQTAFGRFAIAKGLLGNFYSNFGVELGVQSGNSMRLDISEATLDEMGGVPIQSTMKPMLDLLATVKITPTGKTPFFALLKGGVAYRHWQFEGRNSINNLSQIAGEIQAGLGFAIGYAANLSLLYQGVFGGNPNFTLSEACPSGLVSTLPIQQGVLLSFTLNV